MKSPEPNQNGDRATLRAAMDITSAAFYLSVRERVLLKLADAGKIPHRRIGKQVLFIQRDLDAWLDTLPGISVKQALAHGPAAGVEPLAPRPAEAYPDPTPEEPIILKRGPRRHIRAQPEYIELTRGPKGHNRKRIKTAEGR